MTLMTDDTQAWLTPIAMGGLAGTGDTDDDDTQAWLTPFAMGGLAGTDTDENGYGLCCSSRMWVPQLSTVMHCSSG